MKALVLALSLTGLSGLALAAPDIRDLDLAQLKADKAVVLKQETKRLERLLGKAAFAKSDCEDDRTPPPRHHDHDDDDEGVSPYCESRWSDGSCMRYGSDHRGTCYPYCESRWSDGSCMRYGADVCTQE